MDATDARRDYMTSRMVTEELIEQFVPGQLLKKLMRMPQLLQLEIWDMLSLQLNLSKLRLSRSKKPLARQ